MSVSWVLDVSFSPQLPPVFVPYLSGTIVLGMTVAADVCPGELVGVFHHKGQDAVEKWCQENPNWYERYSRPTPTTPDRSDEQRVS
jgi:hypothetical protein